VTCGTETRGLPMLDKAHKDAHEGVQVFMMLALSALAMGLAFFTVALGRF